MQDVAKTTSLNGHGGFFLHMSFLGIFLQETLVEKTMNCSSVYIVRIFTRWL
jgi:hypothetical protein